MNNFYENLKRNNNIDFLKVNIADFNNLNDNDIYLLFEDKTISGDFKTIIAEFCYIRINQLPFNIFVNAVAYINDSNSFITNYGSRISTMTYEEIVSLIYDGYCDSQCLLAITKTEVFNLHLKTEKDNKNEVKLQSFLLSSKIYLANENINELEDIGKEIGTLICESGDQYSQGIEEIISSYLNEIIINIDKVNIDSSIIKSCILMINYSIKCHRLMDSKMIKFYILYRIKDLNLSSICKEVIVSESDNSKVFGYFQNSTETLMIFRNYLETRFRPLFKQNGLTDENELMDLLNINLLQMISHELGHAIDGKRINESRDGDITEQFIEKLKDVDFLNYWYRNGILKLLLGENYYAQNHEQFISENIADLFSFLDSSIQLNKNFRMGFTEEFLQKFVRNNAGRIINLYTEPKENSLNIVSPMQKFDRFFKQMLPNDTEFLYLNAPSNNENNEQAIINNLLLGNTIPRYVLEEILKIANGQKITSDLYFELQSIIHENANLTVDAELDNVIPKQ